jgi:hypothetical protein
MAKTPFIEIGETFTATMGPPLVWSVERRLNDGVHVVLVCDSDPSRRKTVSVWALADRGQFIRVAKAA